MLSDAKLKEISDRWSPPAGQPHTEGTYDEAVQDIKDLVDEVLRVRLYAGDPQAGRS